MNPNRTHDLSSFYKHTTAATARIILTSSKLRWSMPTMFNDPFDVPREICGGIDDAGLRNALVDQLKSLVVKPQLPHSEHHLPLTKFILLAGSRGDEKSKIELMEALEQSRNDPFGPSEGLNLLRGEWRRQYEEMRILCLTERWDSASMWDRYSDGHKGVVLEFACLDEVDSAWLTAMPVTYRDEPLHLDTHEGFARLLLYTIDYAIPKLMHDYTHTKTTDWAYEKEWRVASFKRPHEIGSHSDYGFLPQELTGVIFGSSMSESDRSELEQAVLSHYPHANLWQASTDSGRRLTRRFIK